MPGTWKMEVLLEMPMEEAERQIPPTMAMLDQEPEGVVMSCYTQDLDWMAHFLVNLRCPLVVREPMELHGAMRKLARQVTRLANKSEKRRFG
jgi:hypothetical protein